jgi:beta-xylosidase
MSQAADGSWHMVLLGTRPRGVTPGFHVLGRETFLAAVRWEEGWPVIGEVTLGPSTSTEFNGLHYDFDETGLAPEWLSIRRPLTEFASVAERPGWLTVHGSAATMDSPFPAFVGLRQAHHDCRLSTRVDPGSSMEAGLVLRMDEQSHYEVFVQDGDVAVRGRIGPLSSIVARERVPSGSPVLIVQVVSDASGYGAPDMVSLGYESQEGRFVKLARLDGRYLSTEVAGGFTGRTFGVYCEGGVASFDWVDYEPKPASV